jgi:hypothetical protein
MARENAVQRSGNAVAMGGVMAGSFLVRRLSLMAGSFWKQGRH